MGLKSECIELGKMSTRRRLLNSQYLFDKWTWVKWTVLKLVCWLEPECQCKSVQHLTYTDSAQNKSACTNWLMPEYTVTSQFIPAHTDLSWNTVNLEKSADLKISWLFRIKPPSLERLTSSKGQHQHSASYNPRISTVHWLILNWLCCTPPVGSCQLNSFQELKFNSILYFIWHRAIQFLLFIK